MPKPSRLRPALLRRTSLRPSKELRFNAAYADSRDQVFLAGVPAAFTFDRGHHDGYTVGGGAEYMFAPNWSAKAEYMYYRFDRSTFVTPVAIAPFGSFRDEEHTFKVGLNYRFGWAGGPIAARY